MVSQRICWDTRIWLQKISDGTIIESNRKNSSIEMPNFGAMHEYAQR